MQNKPNFNACVFSIFSVSRVKKSVKISEIGLPRHSLATAGGKKGGGKWRRLGQVWRHFGAVWCHIGQVWHRFGQPWHQKYTQKPCFNAKNAENTKFPRLIQQKNLSGLTSFRL